MLSPDVCPLVGSVYVDVAGLLVLPGFVDLHVHLREPGYEYKETIARGTAAATAGGFTSICCMPNTKPVNDEPSVTRLITMRSREADHAKVYRIGAITKGLAGRELSDFQALKESGCVALSDDGRPVMDDEVRRQAMDQAMAVDLPVIDHCEDLTLSGCGCMNDGPVSRALEWAAMPSRAETRMIERDIRLARKTGARLHVAHVSTEAAVRAVRDAKNEGLSVTAEVCPHHFTLTDEAVRRSGPNAKMNPPLRSERDRAAVIDGVTDGTIDAIATDHASPLMWSGSGTIMSEEERDAEDVFVYRAKRPFHPFRFWMLMQEEWPGVLRSKGYFWVASQPKTCYMWSQAGANCLYERLGRWWVAIPDRHWPKEDAALQELRKVWDLEFGDRRIELAFIGEHMDRSTLTRRLDECLLTRDELVLDEELWRAFRDPFKKASWEKRHGQSA